jgi:hypothetical protein
MTFTDYTDAVLSALKFNSKFQDVIARKQEILDGVYTTENFEPSTILFVGFNPAILSCRARSISVTEISNTALDFIKSQGQTVTYIDPKNLTDYHKKFECVVALDEYFTFANSDSDQQVSIKRICDLATEFVVSTIRDYKNQDFKDREFSNPALVRNGSSTKVFLESHIWDPQDRTSWNTMIYEISEPGSSLVSYGQFERRTMFFKQLAKFGIDAGATNFLVHKNLMYKSLIKKNYEHVVSIQFN